MISRSKSYGSPTPAIPKEGVDLPGRMGACSIACVERFRFLQSKL